MTLYKRLMRPNFTYCANLLLKINAKLGGFNFTPVFPNLSLGDTFGKKPLGADVTHPSGGGGLSVTAYAGSRNHQCTQFTGSLLNVKPPQEVIPEIGGMFLDVYVQWQEDGKKLVLQKNEHGKMYNAESTIMFRDGVSEGQLKQVMENELQSLRRACATHNKQWNPRIAYIVVTKRHHARFFPESKDGDKKTGNVKAALIISCPVKKIA